MAELIEPNEHTALFSDFDESEHYVCISQDATTQELDALMSALDERGLEMMSECESPAEPLPSGWTLVWVAEKDGGEWL